MIEGVTPTEAYILKMYKIAIYGIWNFHDGVYEEDHLLGCAAI
jgi:hypothetical protein